MTNAIAVREVTFDEMARLAEAVAKSGLFGMKRPEEALALMAIAQAEGQHPALAARDYHIVQGKPVLKADAMLARFQSAGGKMKMLDYTDEKVSAEFSHPQGGTVTIDWTIERAKRAGLAGKGTWQQYPRQMLRARVISEGIRTVFPGATAGMMVPEEAIEIPPERAPEVDVTPPKPLTGVAALQARVEAMKPEMPQNETVSDFALTPPSVEDQLLAQLRERALEGSDALREAWDGLGKEHRKTLGGHLASLKEAAAKADADQVALRG